MSIQDPESERKNSFDLVRLMAALAVLISHFCGMSGRPDPIDGFWGTDEDLGGLAVLIFFGLSGYLITDSILRGASFKFYAWSRFLRIYPALIVCLVVCIVAGAFLTRLSFDQYFSPQTSQFFFGNLFPFFWQEQRFLPGVFVPPWNAMNGPLWTIKYELACYITALAVFLFPKFLRRFAFVVLCVLFVIIWLAPIDSWQIPPASTVSSRVARFEYFNMGFFRYYAAIFFLAATARILVGDKPIRWLLLFFSLGIIFAAFYGTPISQLALLSGLSLVGVCVGCSSLLYFNGLYKQRIGDLSYSTYLYGWPISILCILLLASLLGFWPTMLIAAAITLVVACLSWKFVERPGLRLKSRIPRGAPFTISPVVSGRASASAFEQI